MLTDERDLELIQYVVEQFSGCQRAHCLVAKMNFSQYQIKLFFSNPPSKGI